jgi:hypothetical protein
MARTVIWTETALKDLDQLLNQPRTSRAKDGG